MTRTYSELSRLPTFQERYDYLRIGGLVGEKTFGSERYLNQAFYHSKEWLRARDFVIARDDGNDLGCEDHPIAGLIIVHHINPISIEDIIHGNPDIINPEYLISTIDSTHRAIHYGDASLLVKPPVIRMPGDTCPWK